MTKLIHLTFIAVVSIFPAYGQFSAIIEDDSTYRVNLAVQEREKLPTLESIGGKSVMETDAIFRQLRIFLHQKGVKLTDKGLDCFLTLRFYMNAKNQVKAVTYDFGKMYIEDNEPKRRTFSSAEKDSLAIILGLHEILTDFSHELIFPGKYLNPHVHRISINLNRNEVIKKENKFLILMENNKPDTLKTINLSNADLENVPWKELKRFKNAETLTLNENKLETFPKQVLKLKKLKNLDLSGNYLTEEYTFFKRHRRLEVLNLQNNAFTTLPSSLKKIKRLKNLVIGNNSFRDLNQYKFQKHKKLRDLNFYNLNLEQVPATVFKMKRLESLDLYFNNINYLSEDIANLKNLKTLAVSYNDMWSFPVELSQLPTLQVIYAHHNQLDRLPDLPQSMVELDIGYNHFKQFPTNIAQLPNLKLIDYNSNELTEGLETKLFPPNLESLFIRNNPFFHNERYHKQANDFIGNLEKMGVYVK